MRISCLALLAVAVAVVAISPLQADTYARGGLSAGSDSEQAASAATVTLKGNSVDDAETVSVFYGRWRPYWRGYYHGSAGYSPRPHLFYGPVVYPRYYAYRPVYGYPVAYASVVPCSGGTAIASAPTAITRSPVVQLPAAQPIAPNNVIPYDGGPTIEVPPTYVPAPSTAEPPLAAVVPSLNKVKAAPAKRTVGYQAYGDSIELMRPINPQLVRNPN